jgi:hypothetical protein
MSDHSPYETLGLTEASSFDEIQEARDRLAQQHEGDRKQVETIEAAYDAILMERLRLRQEGKIKVPDRIRFPEKAEPAAPKSLSPAPKQSPEWLKGLVDTPERNDILWPALVFSVLCLVAVSSPSLALAVGAGFNLYFLNRKEHKFGRALLFTLLGLIGGIAIGIQLENLLIPQGATLPVDPNAGAAIFTFVIFWLVSSFLR